MSPLNVWTSPCCQGWDRLLTSESGWGRYIPAAGRFLIVCTFIEDALRIITQWNDQLLYLKDYRHSTQLLYRHTPFATIKS